MAVGDDDYVHINDVAYAYFLTIVSQVVRKLGSS